MSLFLSLACLLSLSISPCARVRVCVCVCLALSACYVTVAEPKKKEKEETNGQRTFHRLKQCISVLALLRNQTGKSLSENNIYKNNLTEDADYGNSADL